MRGREAKRLRPETESVNANARGWGWEPGTRRARPVNITGPPRASPLDGPGRAKPDGLKSLAQPDTANGSGLPRHV
jgi:hypothetical protein